MTRLRSTLAALAAAGTLYCTSNSPPDPDPDPLPAPQQQPPDDDPPIVIGPGGTTGGDHTGGGPQPGTEPAGPWPTDSLVNYSKTYGLGRIRDAAVDEGHNIWLLNGASIGVLEPGDTRPTWVSDLGQASAGYSSTVICAGAPGVAYVGYEAQYNDIPGGNFIFYRDGCSFPGYTQCDPTAWDEERFKEYLQGDLDILKLDASGAPALDEHLFRNSTSNRHSSSREHELGLRNSNDFHFDEDRSVYSCTRAVRGPAKGDIFIGTNHGYTRIQGKHFNSHRHPIWYDPEDPGCTDPETCSVTQMAGFAYGIGIAQDGDVLMGNEWTLGIVSPTHGLETWDREADPNLNPEKLKNFVMTEAFGTPSKENFARWRGFEQTTDGTYYVGSRDRGLWKLTLRDRTNARGERVPGAPGNILSMAATGDGSLFIGAGSGLFRMDAAKNLTRVSGVSGSVTRLFYDPSVTPASLYIVAGGELYVLRGH